MSNASTIPDGRRAWAPTTFLRFEAGLDTSMGTARIVTDAGPAYVKPMGNRQGPHPLACEWVATNLASWFGLQTLQFAILAINAEFDEIPFIRGGRAASGPAFATKAAAGHTWGGSEVELRSLVNPGDVGRLVVFDTWVSNCDRHPPDLTARRPNYDNVFLEDVSGDSTGKSRLIAMDHTHCFTCGRDLDARVAQIARVKDDRLYGLFPAFVPLVREDDVTAGVDRLAVLEDKFVRSLVDSVPEQWQLNRSTRAALAELIIRRAEFVAETILDRIARACWPGQLFDNRT